MTSLFDMDACNDRASHPDKRNVYNWDFILDFLP